MQETFKEYRETGRIVIWPSQKFLQKEANANRATVQRAMAQLVKYGHLELVRHGNQFTGSSAYRVVVRKAKAA
jgi:DNA-binding transcriptional regulator YhcF (GntR family)